LRLLDTHFRLLREDTSGLVRDSIRLILDNWEMFASTEGDWKMKRKLLRNKSPTPVRIYSDAEIQRIKCDRKWGLELVVEFNQLHKLRRSSPGKREHCWRTSRELKEGAQLVALISRNSEEDGDAVVIFLIVSKRE